VEEELKIALGVVIPLFRPMVEPIARGNLQSQHLATSNSVHNMVPGDLGQAGLAALNHVEEGLSDGPGAVIPLFRPMVEIVARGFLIFH